MVFYTTHYRTIPVKEQTGSLRMAFLSNFKKENNEMGFKSNYRRFPARRNDVALKSSYLLAGLIMPASDPSAGTNALMIY